MEDCENKGADNGGLSVSELVMKYPTDGNREDGDDTGVEWSCVGNLQQRKRD